MPIIETGVALAYRTGVNKGPGFWFAVFLSLLSFEDISCVFLFEPCYSWDGSQRHRVQRYVVCLCNGFSYWYLV